MLMMNGNRDDFIDVEVDDGSGESREKMGGGRAGSQLFRSDGGANQEDEEDKGLLAGVRLGLSKLLGGEGSKQTPAARKKRQRKVEMNKAIDDVFKEVGVGGIGGTILKAAAKGFGGMISDMASDFSADFADVQEAVVKELRRDSKARFMLGDGDTIQAGTPFSSSSFSSSVDGSTTRTVSYLMPVGGSTGQAEAGVEAVVDARTGTVTLESLYINNGVQRLTIVSPGGGGRGGGGGGDVIDVETV
jgi:hypothetical protein